MKKSLKSRVGFCICIAVFFFIIQFDPDVKKMTKMTDAIQNGDADTVESILKNEKPIDEGEYLSVPYLIEAIVNNKIDIVKLFIKYDADVNVVAHKHNSTALYIAACKGNEEIVNILINNGSEINIKNKLEETPLMCAVQNGHYNVAKLLIQSGADINAKRYGYRDKENVLTFAVQSLEFEIVKLLVNHNVKYDKEYIAKLKENRKKMAFKYHGNKNFNEEFMTIIFYLEEKLSSSQSRRVCKSDHKITNYQRILLLLPTT